MSRQKSLHQKLKVAPEAPRAALKAPKVLQSLDKLAPKVLQFPDKLAPRAALKAPKLLQDLENLPPKAALEVAPGALKATPRAPTAVLEALRVALAALEAAQDLHPQPALALRALKKREDAILLLTQCLEIAQKQAPALHLARAPHPLPILKMLMKMNQWIQTNLVLFFISHRHLSNFSLKYQMYFYLKK